MFLRWIQLMRINRPIGFLLLGWPTLAALWLSHHHAPPLRLILLFIAGIIITRSAGCIINDLADIKFDAHVARTKTRPLTAQTLTPKHAYIGLLLLGGFALAIILQLNWLCFYLAIMAVALTILYPFCKRFFFMPQLILGITFNAGILLAYAATANHIPLQAWFWFVIHIFWTLAYDTQYALADQPDDEKLGLKSSATFFQQRTQTFIVFCQTCMILLLLLFNITYHYGIAFYIAIAIACILFIYQFAITQACNRAQYIKAFKNSQWVGFVCFIAIVWQLH